MTLQIDGVDIGQAIEIAAWVGSILTMLVVGLIIYLLVRPPRRSRAERRPDPDPLAVEEMIRTLDRMEQRLEVLERALESDRREHKEVQGAGEGPDMRRLK